MKIARYKYGIWQFNTLFQLEYITLFLPLVYDFKALIDNRDGFKWKEQCRNHQPKYNKFIGFVAISFKHQDIIFFQGSGSPKKSGLLLNVALYLNRYAIDYSNLEILNFNLQVHGK